MPDFPKPRTIGDNHNLVCPHCGANNSYVCQGIKVTFRKVALFRVPCRQCAKIMHCQASYRIQVIADANP